MEYKNPLLLLNLLVRLISFSIAITFIFKSGKPSYLTNFYIYPTIAFLLLLNKSIAYYSSQYQAIMTNDIIQILDNLSFIIHFFILGTLLKNNINSNKGLFEVLFYIMLITILILFFSKDLKQKNGIAYGVTNTFLIVFCIIYFFQLFRTPPLINLTQEPSFWIINGVFFGMITTIPINFSGEQFVKMGRLENIKILKTFGLLSYSIMHLFFIKGYLCIIRPHKVL